MSPAKRRALSRKMKKVWERKRAERLAIPDALAEVNREHEHAVVLHRHHEVDVVQAQVLLYLPGEQVLGEKKYEVLVGNVGVVYAGDDLKRALDMYGSYRRDSIQNVGRVAGEYVTLLRDGDVWREHPNG